MKTSLASELAGGIAYPTNATPVVREVSFQHWVESPTHFHNTSTYVYMASIQPNVMESLGNWNEDFARGVGQAIPRVP